MAATQLEKVRVMRYLGWPAKTVISGTTHFNNIINQRFDGLDDETLGVMRDMLDRLENLDEKLKKSHTRLGASVIGDITMNEREPEELRAERRREIRELSELLDIEMQRSNGTMVSVLS